MCFSSNFGCKSKELRSKPHEYVFLAESQAEIWNMTPFVHG